MGAFDRLSRRHDRKTFAFVRRMLHPTGRAMVEDLQQKGWLAVAAKAASIVPAKTRFSTWLYTVLRNRVPSRLRAPPAPGRRRRRSRGARLARRRARPGAG